MNNRFPLLVILLLCVPFSLYPQSGSQSRPNSPVFKSYLPPLSIPLLEQSDATYQLWQGFRVQQEANAGKAVSQFELSVRYLTGRGFKPDTVRAAYWAARAAEQNHLLARFNLGIFQYNGWGTEWNPFEAYRNFLYAAERHIPEAQHVIAQLLTENLVVPRNWNDAYRFAKAAADSGYAPAAGFLKELERRGYMPLPQIDSSTVSPSIAATHQPRHSSMQLLLLDFSPDTAKATPDSILVADGLRAAELVRNDSMFALFSGIQMQSGTPMIDSVTAERIGVYADAGSPEAITLLARMHETASGPLRDIVQAAALYLRAVRLDSRRASQMLYALTQEPGFFTTLKFRVGTNDPVALYTWAGLVALGFDRQLTDGQALNMLERSHAAGYPPATIELALAYYAGRWVPANQAKAGQLLKDAAGKGSAEASVRQAVLAVRSKRPDIRHSVEVLQRNTFAGSVLAQFAMGYCYHTGTGVEEDKGRAAQLYIGSGQRGSQDALRALERMYDEIRPADLAFRITR